MVDIDNLYKIYLQSTGVETDTRKMSKGKLFFALKGDNFDGNQYALNAIENGAIAAVIDNEKYQLDDRFILVPDSLHALQLLSMRHREELDIPVLAITGSNGKTTTKELIHRVLSQKYETTATVGNLNNHIGIPLTLLQIPSTAQFAIVEMGANHRHEIESYCIYAQPNLGLITNCGKAHLEGFGGIEGVKMGKKELYDYIRKVDEKVFVNEDLDYLMEMSEGMHRVTYGSADTAYCRGELVDDKNSTLLTLKVDNEKVKTQLTGAYNFPNVMAAICIGKYYDVPWSDIKSAIESYQPDNSRSQIINKDNYTIILDAYNANPTSMSLAIENFRQLPDRIKVVALGGMKELGESSVDEHQHIVDELSDMNFDDVILVGVDFAHTENRNFHYFQNSEEAGNYIQSKYSNQPIALLIKGSRATKMETILKYL